jgi:hypothetical protein
MNGDAKELSYLYIAALKDFKAQKEGKCPPPSRLLMLARGLIRTGKRERIIRHLETCPDCARDYSAVYQIVQEEKNFLAEAEKINKRTSTAGRESGKRWNLHPVLSLRTGLAAALVFCLALAAGTVFITRTLKTTGDLRSGGLNQVKIISPVHKTLTPGNIVFKWKNVKAADYYVVEFFDGEMNPAWRSTRVEDTNLALPREMADKIQVDGSYFWMVTAYMAGGDRVESDLNEFSVKR